MPINPHKFSDDFETLSGRLLERKFFIHMYIHRMYMCVSVYACVDHVNICRTKCYE